MFQDSSYAVASDEEPSASSTRRSTLDFDVPWRSRSYTLLSRTTLADGDSFISRGEDGRATRPPQRSSESTRRGEHAGVSFIHMELVEGRSLDQVLRSVTPSSRRYDAPWCTADGKTDYVRLAEMFADVADGLQHAHDQLVYHRDLKPSNLILGSDDRLRIVDFGVALAADQTGASQTTGNVGTLLYTPPEQFARSEAGPDSNEEESGNAPSRAWVARDIYSLGATMWEAVAGTPLIRSRTASGIIAEILRGDPRPLRTADSSVPAVLEAILGKCLEQRPDRRFGTAEALSQELRRFALGQPTETVPETRLHRLYSRAWRRRRPIPFRSDRNRRDRHESSRRAVVDRIERCATRPAVRHVEVESARETIIWEEIRQATEEDRQRRASSVPLESWEEVPVSDPEAIGRHPHSPRCSEEVFELRVLPRRHSKRWRTRSVKVCEPRRWTRRGRMPTYS